MPCQAVPYKLPGSTFQKFSKQEAFWGRRTAVCKVVKMSTYRWLICLQENVNAWTEMKEVPLPLLLNSARIQCDRPLKDHCCPLLKQHIFHKCYIFLCLGPLNQEHISPETPKTIQQKMSLIRKNINSSAQENKDSTWETPFHLGQVTIFK